MSALNSIFVLALAFLAVFAESSFGTFRRVLGAQIDLLPGLMVYASLTSGIGTVTLLSVLGGLWFDTLSANPLGSSTLPLFAIGFVVQQLKQFILHDQPFAQLVIGIIASGVSPLMTLLLLFSFGSEPLIRGGFVWQWIVMTVVGGLTVPLYFRLFEKVYRTLGYERVVETSFRQDREIARGRQ